MKLHQVTKTQIQHPSAQTTLIIAQPKNADHLAENLQDFHQLNYDWRQLMKFYHLSQMRKVML